MTSSKHWENYWSDESQHDWWKRPAPRVLEFIAMLAPRQRPRALDLGCGLGRHAIALAQAGFEVAASDASATAIAHLEGWARELALSINTKICDFLDDVWPPGSFDVVLSYNVIYHGYQEQFAQAIELVWSLLRPGGLFFFTCPSRQDGKYGHGQQVAPHTFLCEKSVTPGDMHYFAGAADLDDLLVNWKQLSREKDESYWDNRGARQFYSNWQVLVEKPPLNPPQRGGGAALPPHGGIEGGSVS
jgi:SAM-dependent methyltransferase